MKFALWKNADPDVSVLVQAKAEYQALQDWRGHLRRQCDQPGFRCYRACFCTASDTVKSPEYRP